MNYSLNLEEELKSEANRTGKKPKKTFIFEGFFPTGNSRVRRFNLRAVPCVSLRHRQSDATQLPTFDLPAFSFGLIAKLRQQSANGL
jgi:hypothetical protein